MSNKIDFNQVKKASKVNQVLRYYNIHNLKEKGGEMVGWCPLSGGHGKDDSFSFNFEKKVFQCFACKKRGSTLDFVREMEKTGIKQAGAVLDEINKGKPPLTSLEHDEDVPPSSMAPDDVVGYNSVVERDNKNLSALLLEASKLFHADGLHPAIKNAFDILEGGGDSSLALSLIREQVVWDGANTGNHPNSDDMQEFNVITENEGNTVPYDETEEGKREIEYELRQKIQDLQRSKEEVGQLNTQEARKGALVIPTIDIEDALEVLADPESGVTSGDFTVIDLRYQFSRM